MGIDVGLHKGLDVVVLDGECGVELATVVPGPQDVATLIEEWVPDVVCIDSPPGPGLVDGERSRAGERALRTLGVNVFSTPSDPERYARPFYAWMRVGEEVFAVAERCGYPLLDQCTSVRGHALEVFPHATDVFLRGCLPPASVRSRMSTRRAWRAGTLVGAGVDVDALCRNTRGDVALDSIDAALAAVTGLHALRGDHTCLGGSGELLVVPGSPPPVRFTRCAHDG
ncbi:MAG: DUF429 domain-containing protein [Acidimicrobiales bacterium]